MAVAEGHIDIHCPVTGEVCSQLEGLQSDHFRTLDEYEVFEDPEAQRQADMQNGHIQVAEVISEARANAGLCLESTGLCGVVKGWEIEANAPPLTTKQAIGKLLRRFIVGDDN